MNASPSTMEARVGEPPSIGGAELAPEDDKARAALERYALAELTETGPAFDEAYGVLAAEFGPRGELERRDVVSRWLHAPVEPAGSRELERRYHFIVARDRDGGIAGVRDCHVIVDPGHGVVVVYLAHVLVLAEHRRTGLASLLRSVAVALGRRAIARQRASTGCGRRSALLLAAEMDPVAVDAASGADPAAVVRLIAYGRAGFRAIAPRWLPYCQPDFRDPEHAERLADFPRPLPLLPIVRWVDHEDAPELGAHLARAFILHLDAVFATHCREIDRAPARDRALATLRHAGDHVPLLRLPTRIDEVRAVLPLGRDEVLKWQPSPVARRAAPPPDPALAAARARGGFAS